MALFPVKSMEFVPIRNESILTSLSENHKVITAPVCTSLLGIECIDGLCNDRTNDKWWTIEVNGDYTNFNAQSVVSPSDKVVLKYASSKEK